MRIFLRIREEIAYNVMKMTFEYQPNKEHISWKIGIFANDSKLEKSFWYVFSIILRNF